MQHSLSFPPDTIEPKEYPEQYPEHQPPSPDHKYVNIRDETSSRQQYYATLATIPQATPSVANQAPMTLLTPPDNRPTIPFRNRASTESRINYTPLSASTAKTLPSKFRNQGGGMVLLKEEGQSDDVFGGGITGPSRRELFRQHQNVNVSKLEPSQQPSTVSPITRGRSHAISKSNLDLTRGDVSPRPPVRHQSLSRARSNPSKDIRVEEESSLHPYERVPPRFDQSLSGPATDGGDAGPQRRQTASPILRQPPARGRPANFTPGRRYDNNLWLFID